MSDLPELQDEVKFLREKIAELERKVEILKIENGSLRHGSQILNDPNRFPPDSL